MARLIPYWRKFLYWMWWILPVPLWCWPWPAMAALSWQDWLWRVVVMPALEEWVFRAGLQHFLWQKAGFWQGGVWGFSCANLGAAFCFALLHLLSQSPVWALAVFFPGLVFGWVYQRYQSWFAAACLHAWYNLGWLWVTTV